MDTPDYLTTRQAAERLGCSQRRVQQLIHDEVLPCVTYGWQQLILPADLDALPPPPPEKGGWPRGKPRTGKEMVRRRKKLRKKSP
jgi:excisionase family DNA binding protein